LLNHSGKYFIIKFTLVAGFIYLFTCSSSAQITASNFEKIKTLDESISKKIKSLVKDSSGILWFGTTLGLCRFDGHSCKIFKTEGLTSNWINNIYSSGNYIWVCSFNGFKRFNKLTEQFKIFKNDPQDSSSISYDNVTSVCFTKNNEMWVGTLRGLNKFDFVTEKFIRYKYDQNGIKGWDNINYLYEDNEGYLWIASLGGGLYIIDVKNNTFKNYRFNPSDNHSISSNDIRIIREDKYGYFWIGTGDKGVNKFDKINEKFYRYEFDSLKKSGPIGNNISTIAEDEHGNLWFGGTGGISIFDPMYSKFENIEYFKVRYDNYTNNIYADDKGIVWICTPGYGFRYYNKRKWNYDIYYHIIKRDTVSFGIICEDSEGNIWLGTDYKGIDVLNKNYQIIKHFENNPKDPFSLSSNQIHSIYRGKSNFLWIITEDGTLHKYNPVNNRFTRVFNFGKRRLPWYFIFEDSKENIWLSLYRDTLRVFDKNGNFIKKYFNEESEYDRFDLISILAFYEDNLKNMWIATSRGFAVLDSTSDKWQFYKIKPDDPHSIDNMVRGISAGEKGNLWIISMMGLQKFNISTKALEYYNSNDNLRGGFLSRILFDKKGNLFLTNADRIFMFDPKKEIFTDFNIDGTELGIIFASCFKSDEGKMFFGGGNGFVSFYPDSLGTNQKVPAIAITGFRIFNSEVKLDTSITIKKEITISYKENFFSFDFAALDYTNPAKNEYAYKLEGVDKDWNYVGNIHSASYTDIFPGEYVFRVKGSNNDGVWNEEGTLILLKITPPWWLSWWFKSCAAVIFLFSFGYGVKKRINKIQKEKKLQEDFTKQLIESQENERKRVAAELHDSLGQDLLIIKNIALVSLKKDDNVLKLKKQLNEISELTSSTLDDIRNISYNLRPYELDRMGLTKTINSLIERANKSTNIKFNCRADNIDKIFDSNTEINIYRIIQECISNVIKHSGTAEADVRITRFTGEVSINVSDNGVGFDTRKKFSDSEKTGFGLKGISERVRLLGGKFEIKSETGRGTKISIMIVNTG